MKSMANKKIAILAADGHERALLERALEKCREKGAQVELVSISGGPIRMWSEGRWAGQCTVDCALRDASDKNFDVLLMPKGFISPDKLKQDKEALEFLSSFSDTGDEQSVTTICRGNWTLTKSGFSSGLGEFSDQKH